jgi:hypothetical protein
VSTAKVVQVRQQLLAEAEQPSHTRQQLLEVLRARARPALAHTVAVEAARETVYDGGGTDAHASLAARR